MLPDAGGVTKEDLEVAPPGRNFFSLNFAQELLRRLPASLTRHAAILGFECMCSRQTFQHKHFRHGKTDHETGDVNQGGGNGRC